MPHEDKRTIWGLPLVLVLAAVLVLAVSIFVTRRPTAPAQIEDISATKERVLVTQTDVTAADPSAKLPVGFPQGIPVEAATITESIRSEYADRGAVQFQVSFVSQKGPVELFKEYQDYMTLEAYDFGSQGLNPETGSLYGVKDGDDLSVVISSTGMGSGTLVQIGYLDRQ